MTPQDIAAIVLISPPTTPERFAKLARLVSSQAKLEQVVALLPERLRVAITTGMRGRVT